MKKRIIWITLLVVLSTLIAVTIGMLLEQDNQTEESVFLTSSEQESIDYYKENPLQIGVLNQDAQTEFILTHISDYFDLDYTITYYEDFPSILTDATTGNIDLIGNISFTEERALVLDYTVPTSVEQVFLYTTNNQILEESEPITIAISGGTVYTDLFESIYENVTFAEYTTIENFFEVMNSGTVDGAINNMIVYEQAIHDGYYAINLNELTTVSPVAIVAMKDSNTNLISAFSKYISSKEYQEQLTSFDKNYTNEIHLDHLIHRRDILFPDGNITINYKLENNPPFASFDSNDNVDGIFSDIIDKICMYLEAECVLQNTGDEDWEIMFDDLISNDIDMLGAMSHTQERTEYIHFSDKIIHNNYYMYMRRDFNTGGADSLTDLIHDRIGALTKSGKTAYLKSFFPNKEFIYYDTQLELIAGLKNNEVDYIPYTEIGFMSYIYDSKDFSMEPNEDIGVFLEREYRLGFQYNQQGEALAELFSIGLRIIDIEEVKNTHIKEVNIYDVYEDNQVISRRIIFVMTISITVLISTVFVYVYFFRKLKHRSHHDELTGSYNRRYFEQQIKVLDIDKNYPLSIVVIDLNGLKLINDAFGHSAGDQLLVKAVNLLNSNLNGKDILARIGGDEFVILMPSKPNAEAYDIMRNVELGCKTTVINSVELSLAYGIYSRNSDNHPFYEEFKIAEDEMYRMKLLDVPSMRTNAIETILTTLYEKDEYSKDHSSAVSVISERIAKKMKFNNNEINDIKVAGLLHDIGKIIIPDAILKKTGLLTDFEYLEIKNHSEIGFRILSSTKDFRKIAEFVLSHHEHYNGKGYPFGKSGEEIPIQARIIQIADAFDAMTSFRSYRPNKSFKEALHEIEEFSGTQFDPKIVKVLKDNFEEITKGLLELK